MSNYPPFSYQPQMNNPYQGNYQPMQNPYMAQMNQQQFQPQIQPQMQAQQQIGLNCRVVDDFSMITANDVPMDGNGAVFMRKDASEVQWRNWTANGTIQTTVYRPVQAENAEQGANMPQMDFNALNEDVRALREDILARLDAIEKFVSTTTKTATRAKKGVDEE